MYDNLLCGKKSKKDHKNFNLLIHTHTYKDTVLWRQATHISQIKANIISLASTNTKINRV